MVTKCVVIHLKSLVQHFVTGHKCLMYFDHVIYVNKIYRPLHRPFKLKSKFWTQM